MATGESVDEGDNLIARAGGINGKIRRQKQLNNKNRSPTTAGGGRDGGGTTKAKRAQYCTICKNHNQQVLKKRHKCPYSDCQCPLCQLSRRVQCIMCHQQRLWRFRKNLENKNGSSQGGSEAPPPMPISSSSDPPSSSSPSPSSMSIGEGGGGDTHLLESAVDDPLSGTELTNNKERLKAEKAGKQQVCDKCRNHDIWILKRGHKGKCPYENCMCEYCSFTIKRRDLMKHQQRVRRAQVTSLPAKDSQDYVLQPAETSTTQNASNSPPAEESEGSPSGLSPANNQEAQTNTHVPSNDSQVTWQSCSSDKAENPRVSPKISHQPSGGSSLSHQPSRESASFQEPNRESTPFQQPHRESTSFQQPHRESTPFQQPHRESTPFQQPHRESTPFQQPHRESTPFQQPHRESTPFQQPHRESTPFQQPHRESTPFQQPHRESTPFQQQNRDSTPFQQPNRDSTPFQQPNRESTPFQQPNRDSTLFQQPNRDSTAFQQPNRDPMPFQHSNRESTTFQRLNRDSLSFQQPNRDSVFQQDVSVNHASAYAPIVAEVPMHLTLKRMKVEPCFDNGMPYESNGDLGSDRDFVTPVQGFSPMRSYSSGPEIHHAARSQPQPKFGVHPEDLLLRHWPTTDVEEVDNSLSHNGNNFRGSSLCHPLSQTQHLTLPQPQTQSQIQPQSPHHPIVTASPTTSFEPPAISLGGGWGSSTSSRLSTGEVSQPHMSAMHLNACDPFIPEPVAQGQGPWWQQRRLASLERTNSG